MTAFAGVPAPGTPPSAWDLLTGGEEPGPRVLRRRAEDHRALAGTGCEPVHLDFVGAVHRGAALDPAALRTALAEAIGAGDPVYVPAAIGGHPDHVATRDAALAVCADRRVLLYADQPYAVRFGWPAWVGGRAPAGGLDVDRWLGAQLAALTPGPPEVVRLEGTARAAKVRAVVEYRSQLAALTASAGHDFPNGPEWGYEVIWPLC
ncbi:hypothetical protein GCM10010532_043870 [Dactylosporangium siamense]|uniref:PIG-L family deacetylase n=1 Tax=Dactylosporangium siamense TaxID=685454 RepID=A0A919PL29_9ACTN|nr:hypothetical protein [Dactylosporangium siamense]GIG45201.1 hypothetical protein Dsi01nite_032420 [Dactylosporangium siamense]